jgi:hypothetical protein
VDVRMKNNRVCGFERVEEELERYIVVSVAPNVI